MTIRTPHPLLQGRRLEHPIGESGTPFVEPDQAGEARQALEQPSAGGEFPLKFQVRHEPGNEYEIDRAIADDLVGDVDITALYVSSLRRLHLELRR